ncbi:hypothetical protein HPB49_003398 [Dermacentor silvarum]|uniref:Uncharacterized protein n=1 Tax=Dermacentor silvarum TaxID=543639 RepID=A0ACB8CP41_DERSI|nr:hypothetical protein HPB49_003398 [Dermacentor silvarum]
MSHELHEGRRKARVDRQRRQFKGDSYVTYVDVAAYPAGDLFAVAAVNGRDNSLTLAASVRAETPAAAETIAVALVIKQHDRHPGMRMLVIYTECFQRSVGSEETIGVTQPAASKCVRRVVEAIVHAGIRNKWVHFPRTSAEKATVKEGFLRRSGIPGIIGCVDGGRIAIIAPKGDNKVAYMCRKGFYALNSTFICDARMRILTVDALRPGSDHDTWKTTSGERRG